MRRPGKHFSTYTHEDGTKWEIRTVEQGKGAFDFFCMDEGLQLRASTPKEVQDLLISHLHEHHKMVWEPVIVTEAHTWRSSSTLGMCFDRYFRGTKNDGHVVFRSWEYKDKKGVLGHEDHRDRLDIGSPGNEAHPDRSSAVFPYTLERWTTLLRLEKAIENLEDKVKDLVSPDDVPSGKTLYDVGVPKRLDDAFKAMGGGHLLANPDSGSSGVLIDVILPEKKTKKARKA